MAQDIRNFQSNVLNFLLEAQALKFGDFTLKSGRKSPYFMNAGVFSDADKLKKLGEFYAQHIVDSGLSGVTHLFGPAYKGIPLAVATALALNSKYSLNVACSYDRKEAKDHGEGGVLWGAPISASSRILIVEDVVTAGTTLQKVVPIIRQSTGAEILGVVILLDRGERVSLESDQDISAVREVERDLQVKVSPILTIHSVRQQLAPELQQKIDLYLEQYGAKL